MFSELRNQILAKHTIYQQFKVTIYKLGGQKVKCSPLSGMR